MTVKAWTNNSYHGGSDSGVGANSLSLTSNVFILKTGNVISKAVATWVISGVNYTTETFASDNQTVAQKEVEFAPANLWRRYIVDVTWQTITFDADLVTSNVVNLKVNGVAMTAETFDTDNATTMAAIAAQLVTDFPTVIASASSNGTDTITVVPVALNNSVVITEVVVTLGASQATATVAPQSIATSDELDYYDLEREDAVDGATNSATSGQVQLVRAISAQKWEFLIANT